MNKRAAAFKYHSLVLEDVTLVAKSTGGFGAMD
jgi:hypothetical protein